MKLLRDLKNKGENTRKQLAAGGAALITVIIALIWVANFNTLSNVSDIGNKKVASEDGAETLVKTLETPLSMIQDTFKEISSGIKGVWKTPTETEQGEEESTTSDIDEESNAEIIKSILEGNTDSEGEIIPTGLPDNLEDLDQYFDIVGEEVSPVEDVSGDRDDEGT